jgi:DNA-binding NtrC family response regulator
LQGDKKVLQIDKLLPDSAGSQEYISIEKQERSFPTLDQATANLIRDVLSHTEGKIGGSEGAAEILQIPPNTLRAKMRKLGVPYGRKANKS